MGGVRIYSETIHLVFSLHIWEEYIPETLVATDKSIYLVLFRKEAMQSFSALLRMVSFKIQWFVKIPSSVLLLGWRKIP